MKANSMSILLLFAALLATTIVFQCAAQNQTPHHNPNAKPNRLINETSPYLLQHAHNPVDWYPWGEEAFQKARDENKPIFLSVGYSTCHWCHVMAHQSFEHDDVAAVLNKHFVSVKVDREELPNIDAQYMLATQIFFQMLGQNRAGGWPNSVWLTPDGRPWYAGTYFPREQFISVLEQLNTLYQTQPEDVERQAGAIAEAIKKAGQGDQYPTDTPISPRLIESAVTYFTNGYDERRGGIGSAPKFPPHGALSLFAHQQNKFKDFKLAGIITHTLNAMAQGGIYDQVGGGFHRYSTDARWFLPHFEKMLYDNAQLIDAYADAFAMTNDKDYARIVDQTFGWLGREMTDPLGGFYSALDADTEGEEGTTYLWTPTELRKILGDKDAAFVIKLYGVTDEGNFEDEATHQTTGDSHLFLEHSLDQYAAINSIEPDDLIEKVDSLRLKLRLERDKRAQPSLDDKVLTSWNGLMIRALANAGQKFDEPRYTDAAAKAADFILNNVQDDAGLLRTWRQGKAKIAAYLDDYAFFIAGLIELYRVTQDDRWLEAADQLAGQMIDRFYDPAEGGFYATSTTHEALLVRAKELGGGGNIPSANGDAIRAVLQLAILKQNAEYAGIVEKSLNHFAGRIAANPHGNESILLALAEFYDLQQKLPEPQTSSDVISKGNNSGADASASEGPVTIQAFASTTTAAPGDSVTVKIKINLTGKYHLYANSLPADSPLIATTLTLDDSATFTLKSVDYPDANTFKDPASNQTLPVYENGAIITATIAIADAAKGEVTLNLSLGAQACDDRSCLLPQTYKLQIPITLR